MVKKILKWFRSLFSKKKPVEVIPEIPHGIPQNKEKRALKKNRKQRRQRVKSGTFANNPPGTRRPPPTWMESPDKTVLKHPRRQKGGYCRVVE